MTDYRTYPEAEQTRSGIKVHWLYFKTRAEAEACAEIARHNARADRERGYDHGYCSPGEITPPGRQGWHPDLHEVCCA